MHNLLEVKSRSELREWLRQNHDRETECWVAVRRGRPVDDGTFRYVDAVEEHEADQVSIYPNPVDDMLHIEGVTTGTSITLYDMTGRLVLSDRAYGGAMTFDMSALKRGVYLCRIQNKTYKIVKR